MLISKDTVGRPSSLSPNLSPSLSTLCIILRLLYLLFLLFWLHSCVVNIPNYQTLKPETDEDDDEVDEEVRLVVQDSDGLVGGADFLQPVKVGHFLLS